MEGPRLELQHSGYAVRAATEADMAGLQCTVPAGPRPSTATANCAMRSARAARLVEHLGRITAYASEIAFFGHAVAETNQGLQALIGAAPGFEHGGFLLPTRNGELFRWCLGHGLRLVHQMTLMTTGLYNEPAGAYLPRCYTELDSVGGEEIAPAGVAAFVDFRAVAQQPHQAAIGFESGAAGQSQPADRLVAVEPASDRMIEPRDRLATGFDRHRVAGGAQIQGIFEQVG